MHLYARRQFRPGLALFSAALIGVAPALTTCSRRASLMSENNAAMATMMGAMNVEPSGDADADFVAAMRLAIGQPPRRSMPSHEEE
jgi:hypothetical protein